MKNIFKRSLCLLTAILIVRLLQQALQLRKKRLIFLKSRLDMPIFEIRKPILRLPGDWLIVQHLFSAPTSSYDVELTVELQQNRSGWYTYQDLD